MQRIFFGSDFRIKLFQNFSPFSKSEIADIFPLPLQHIISLQDHRRFLQQIFGNIFSAYTGLQIIKGTDLALRKRQNLTIQHGSVWNEFRENLKFGIFIGNQFFPAAPNK